MVPARVRIVAAAVSLVALAGLCVVMMCWAPPSAWSSAPGRVWWLGTWIGVGVWVVAYAGRWAVRGRGPGGRGRHAAVWAMVLAACVWAGHGAAALWLRSDPWFFVVHRHVWMVLGLAGVALAAAGWRRRVGNRLLCRRCRYERTEPFGPVCPECGHDWCGPRGVVVGTPRWGFWRLGVGVAVLVFALSAWQVVRRMPAARLAADIAAVLPTDVLVFLVAPEGPHGQRDVAASTELLRREMTPAQEARLARRLLASRRWRGQLNPITEFWLLDAAEAGRLPKDIEEAYFAGLAEPALVAVHWPAGPGAEVSLVGTYRPRFTRRWTHRQQFEARLYVSHFTVRGAAAGDGVVPVRRVYRMGDPSGSGGALTGRLLPAGMAPSVRLVPPERGAAEVTATLWLVYVGDSPVARLGMPMPDWNEDGTPRLPSEVLWSREVVLTLDVARRQAG